MKSVKTIIENQHTVILALGWETSMRSDEPKNEAPAAASELVGIYAEACIFGLRVRPEGLNSVGGFCEMLPIPYTALHPHIHFRTNICIFEIFHWNPPPIHISWRRHCSSGRARMQAVSLNGRDYISTPAIGNMPADPFCNPVKGKFEERRKEDGNQRASPTPGVCGPPCLKISKKWWIDEMINVQWKKQTER